MPLACGDGEGRVVAPDGNSLRSQSVMTACGPQPDISERNLVPTLTQPAPRAGPTVNGA